MCAYSKSNGLPLTKIALYKHGIGYFERRGKFNGPGEIEILCGPGDIDDMLKSLLVLRSDERPISAVTYDSSKTLETRLAESGFDLRTCDGLLELLSRLKGTPVSVQTGNEVIKGRVIGLDEVEISVGDHTLDERQLVLYGDDNSFKRINATTISGLTVDDPSLAQEIQQQLELLFQSVRKKDRKMLKVQVAEEGEHDLTIAYSVPSPI
jgi:hypothetical protein